jgi:hypothetical protein
MADFGYRSSGSDPDDASGIADVSWTRRVVWQGPDGRRWIRLKIRAYEPLRRVWGGFEAPVDFRAGPRRDGTISFVNIEGPPYCSLNLPGSGWIVPARQVGRTISCTFPLRHIEPTKRIRWFVRSPHPDTFDPPDVDRAPDSGWYV